MRREGEAEAMGPLAGEVVVTMEAVVVGMATVAACLVAVMDAAIAGS